MSREIVITSAVRTPLGSFQGSLAGAAVHELGSAAIAGAISKGGIAADSVDEVYMGCVLAAGAGQAPARQASRAAGVPDAVGCTTVNKVCGSGMMTLAMARRAILCGEADTIVAGGMESMSNVPFLLPKARAGLRLGHGQLLDGVIHDGLWDPYDDSHMGQAAELCAREREISRERQDDYAVASYERSRKAVADGEFEAELVPVEIAGRRGKVTRVESDEEPARGDLERLRTLRPAFDPKGSVTAGNASTLNDGASALVLRAGSGSGESLARVIDLCGHAQAPSWFTTAPAGAVRKLLDRTGRKVEDIALWEINEAFAVVALANLDELGISHDKLNVRGGAVSLGHPIGCSGARIVTTLVHSLRARGGGLGVASICIGGGEALAVMLEV